MHVSRAGWTTPSTRLGYHALAKCNGRAEASKVQVGCYLFNLPKRDTFAAKTMPLTLSLTQFCLPSRNTLSLFGPTSKWMNGKPVVVVQVVLCWFLV